MIERAFEEARRQNRGVDKQLALDRAMDILRAAKIVDPKITDAKPVKAVHTVETPSLEAFLEGKVRRTVEIGGKSAEQLETELRAAKINIGTYALDMLHSPKFTTLPEPEPIDTVGVRVGDLGLKGNSTTDRIYAKAQELGLELCPAEVGPHMRLAYQDQLLNEWFAIAMEQIADRDGHPGVFHLLRYEDGLWLHSYSASLDSGWDPGPQFVFALRKAEPVES